MCHFLRSDFHIGIALLDVLFSIFPGGLPNVVGDKVVEGELVGLLDFLPGIINSFGNDFLWISASCE